MNFTPSDKAQSILRKLKAFIRAEIEPVEPDYHRQMAALDNPWQVLPVIRELKDKVQAAGLWNLFLPDPELGQGLSNRDYAPMAEAMGASLIAPEIFNCNAPDSGNMEVLYHYGSPAQKARWLKPLAAGEIRSAFCMTEPEAASSDATNMQATATIEGEEVVVDGRKWWSTGLGHPDCRFGIFRAWSCPGKKPGNCAPTPSTG